MITLDRLEIRRGGVSLLADLTVTLEPGLVHAVIGPNGAGKTSLIRAIFGDLPLSAGSIRFDEATLVPGDHGSRRLRAWRVTVRTR